MPGYAVVLLVMAGVVLIGGACVLAFIFVRRKNNAVSTEAVEIEETAEIVVEEDNNTQE
jgi:flagellar basal body-associated protein FliL